MDLLINAFGLLAIVSGGVLAIVGIFTHWKNKESLAIWAFYFTIAFALTAFFVAWQKNIWEREAKAYAQKFNVARPSLTVERAKLVRLEDGRGYVEVRVMNSGQDVAQNATSDITLWGVPTEDDGRECPEPQQAPMTTMQSAGPIGIGQITGSGTGIIFTPEQVTNIEQGKIRLYVHLVSTYEGSIGKYSMEFYGRYDHVARNFQECSKHNKAT